MNLVLIIFWNNVVRSGCSIVLSPCFIIIRVTNYTNICWLNPNVIGVFFPTYPPKIRGTSRSKSIYRFIVVVVYHNVYERNAVCFFWVLDSIIFLVIAICLFGGETAPILVWVLILATCKKVLAEEYPDRKIICVDSMRYSTALSMLVIEAAIKRSEGYSLEETAKHIDQNKHRLHQIGPMDDLFFLCKTGRISNFKAFFGTLVGINPMADFNRHGLSEVLAKLKGKKANCNHAGRLVCH